MVKVITKETVNSRKAIIATKKEFARAIKGFKHAGNGVYVNYNGTKVYEVYGQNIYHVAYVDRKISKNNCGYMQCGSGLVHHLVARAWCKGWSEEKNEVDHLDGNKENNNWKNLQWVSHSENMKRAWNNNQVTPIKSFPCRYMPTTQRLSLPNGSKIKMTPEEYIAWRKENGLDYKRQAKKLGVKL